MAEAFPPRRVLGLDLAEGATKTNLMAALALSATTTAAVAFIPTSQPYIFGAVLEIAQSEHGRVASLLGFAAEIAMLASHSWYGALADRIGRRPIVIAGLALIALGIVLYPMAVNVATLVVARVIWALGAAALLSLVVTIATDYVRDGTRGKSYGFVGITTGVGGVIAALALARLPGVFESLGLSPTASARIAYAIIAGALLVVAALLWRTLSPVMVSATASHIPLRRQVREGFAAAKDPGVALAYAASFVARTDLAITATFATLWVSNAAESSGLSSGEALARGGTVLGVTTVMVIVFAYPVGWLSDRVKRQNLVIVTQAVAVVAYLSTLLIDDPLGSGIFPVMALIGIAEIAMLTTAGSLLAQQAPRDVRGSAFGVQLLFGAFGILVASVLGGFLYDYWRPAAPFVVCAMFSVLTIIFGLAVRNRIVFNPEAMKPPAEVVAHQTSGEHSEHADSAIVRS